MYLYEIEYRYLDELVDGNEPHNALIVLYDSSDGGDGKTFDYTLDKSNELEDYTEADSLLEEKLGVDDDDICFYYDIKEIFNGTIDKIITLVPELQKSFDIYITDINLVRKSYYGTTTSGDC